MNYMVTPDPEIAENNEFTIYFEEGMQSRSGGIAMRQAIMDAVSAGIATPGPRIETTLEGQKGTTTLTPITVQVQKEHEMGPPFNTTGYGGIKDGVCEFRDAIKNFDEKNFGAGTAATPTEIADMKRVDAACNPSPGPVFENAVFDKPSRGK